MKLNYSELKLTNASVRYMKNRLSLTSLICFICIFAYAENIEVEDKHKVSIVGDTDSMSVSFFDHNCSADSTTYELIVTIQGGEQPFTLNEPGTVSFSTITYNSLVDTQAYDFSIVDAAGCIFEFSYGPIDCDCQLDVGTVINYGIPLCEDYVFEPSYISLKDYTIVSGVDTFAYYFYENEDDPKEDYVFISDGSPFMITDPLQTNTVYFLRLIVGPIDPNTDGVDLTQPCVDVSKHAIIVWIAELDVTIELDTVVCENQEYFSWQQEFPESFLGPYDVTFTSDDGIQEVVSISDVEQQVSLPVLPGTTHWEVTEVSALCGWTYEGSIVISTSNVIDSIEVVPFDSICNNTFGGNIVLLDELLVDAVEGDWYLNNELLVDDEINFEGFFSGTYTLTFIPINMNGQCFKETSFDFKVKKCHCIEVNFPDVYVCYDSITISSLGIFPGGSYLANLININNYENPASLHDALQDKTPGVYQLWYMYTGSPDSTCQEVYTANLFFQAVNEAELEDSAPVFFCEGDQLEIDLDSYLTDSSGIGTWNSSGSTTSVNFMDSELDFGENYYQYVTELGEYCSADSVDLILTKTSYPEVTVISDDVLCFGENNGSLDIEILADGYGPFVCSVNNETSNGSKLIENLPPGEYTVSVSNDFGCVSEIEPISIVEPQPVSVTLGDDKLLEFNDEYTVEAIVSILTSDIAEINWTDLDGVIDSEELELLLSAVKNNSIQIVISDENGCQATDLINIRIKENDIELANVINLNSEDPINRSFGIPAIYSIAQVNTFQVYDRWGGQVYKAEDFLAGSEEAYWDGTFKGDQVQQGVYSYYVEFESVLGVTRKLVGSVTVLK